MTLSIEKRNYSSNPWRLVFNGQEVYRTELFDHPDLGQTRCEGPVCGNTKTECLNEAFRFLEERMQAMKERIEGLKKEVETLRSYGNKDCIAMADEALEQAKLLAPETPAYTINRDKAKPTALERVERLANDPMYRLDDWDDEGAQGLTEETFAFSKRVADALDKAGVIVDHVCPDWSAEILFEVGLSEIKIWGCPMPDESPTPNPPPNTINRDEHDQHH